MSTTQQRTADLPAAVAALLDGTAIPDAVPAPHLIQTHISWVVVAGEDVFKLKKPVSLGFLDFSTLDKRHDACLRELELNRRLCQDVYLGVRAVRESNGRVKLDPPDAAATGDVLDYAVWMRRLPEDRMLDKLVADGSATVAMVQAVADQLATFHATAATGPGVDEFGAPDMLRANAEENFEQVRPFIGRSIDESTWTTIREATRRVLDRQGAQFEQRIAEGHIRDGHGDLHASNICMTDPVAIFDCIEFNDRFRYGDVASEVGFLAMDLEYSHRPDLARAFVDRYAEAGGDRVPRLVLDFYIAYRAYVRGKVESMKLDEPEIAEPEREAAQRDARRYFDLARRDAERLA
jgi:aminoglycoside phosphotransferase family enzyme